MIGDPSREASGATGGGDRPARSRRSAWARWWSVLLVAGLLAGAVGCVPAAVRVGPPAAGPAPVVPQPPSLESGGQSTVDAGTAVQSVAAPNAATYAPPVEPRPNPAAEPPLREGGRHRAAARVFIPPPAGPSPDWRVRAQIDLVLPATPQSAPAATAPATRETPGGQVAAKAPDTGAVTSAEPAAATGPAQPAAVESGATRTAAPASPPAVRRSVAGDYSEIGFVPTERPVLALTFDCGANRGHVDDVLDTLRAYGVQTTFFVTGDFAELYPDVILQMAADGHELANHTMTHRDLVDLSDWTIRQEMRQTDEIISGLTGYTTQPLMRMPFGSRNARVLRIVAEEGYRSIYWSLDSGDWRTTATAPGVLSRVLGGAEAGDIIVHHCAPAATAWSLAGILEGLAEQGLSVVTVSNLLQDE